MKKPLHHLLFVMMLALSACTNPFGGNSFVDVAAVSLDWNNKNFDFGNQQIGSSSVKTFIISNSGNTDATDCGNVRLSDNLNFSIVSQTCHGTTLAQGSQCEVVVESHPQSAGEKSLVIDRQCRVKSNIVSLVNQVKVTAILPTANWTPMSHSFGIIQTGYGAFSKTFTLSNSGASAIGNCGLVTLSNPTDFYIQNDSCGLNNIAQGGSCEVTIVARPSSAGIKRTTLSRTCESSFTFATTSDQITVEGFDSFLTLYPPSIDFGDVTESTSNAYYPYMQNNSAEAPVSCDVATLSDNTNFNIVYDDCGTRGLGQWDGCTVGIETASSAARGEHISSLVKSCTFADSSVKTVTIPLRMNIIPAIPIMYFFNNSHDYGNVYVGGAGSTNHFYFYNGGHLAAQFVSDSRPSYYMGLNLPIASLGWGNARVQCMIDSAGDLYCSGGNSDTVYEMTPQPVKGL